MLSLQLPAWCCGFSSGEVHDFKVKAGFCGSAQRVCGDGRRRACGDGRRNQGRGEEMDDEAKTEGKKKKKKVKKTKASSSRDPGLDKMD